MQFVDIIAKIWPVFAGLIAAGIWVAIAVIKLHTRLSTETSTATLNRSELQGRIDLLKQETQGNKHENQREFESLKMVTLHLTKAGESLKENHASFLNLVGDLRQDIALSQQSINSVKDIMKEIKDKLDKQQP